MMWVVFGGCAGRYRGCGNGIRQSWWGLEDVAGIEDVGMRLDEMAWGAAG